MDYKVLEDLLPKANMSIYGLVRLAARRALELSDGKKCLSDMPLSEKATTKALEEIYEGKVVARESEALLFEEEKEPSENETV